MTDDMLRMQKEAEARVRAMQEKAKAYTARTDEMPQESKPCEAVSARSPSISSDKLLIAALLLLLTKDRAGPEIIVALLYILL